LKKTIKYLFYSLLTGLLAVLVAVLLLFNSTTFQTWVTSSVTGYLSAQFKTKITIDHIKYHPFGGFSLDNVYWGDQKQDTLFFVDELRFNFGGFNKNTLTLTLNDVIVEGGYCKMTTYPDNTFNIDVLFNIFDPNDTIPDTTALPFSLYFNRVACHNTRFRLIDSTEAFEPEGFDGFNQDFNNIELLARDFWIVNDSLHFDLKKLATTERSGFRIDHISAIGTICPTAMLFDSIDVKTPFSHITKTFHMRYNGWDEMSDFNQKVKLVADIENSTVNMQDIAYFAPFLSGSTQKFLVNGKGTGTIDNIKISTLDLSFGGSSKFTGSGSIKGLPNIDETFLDLKAKEAQTNKLDLERLITIDLPAEMAQLGSMKFNGRYTGFFNDFVAFGDFSTALGKGQSDLNMKLGDSLTLPSYSGSLTLRDFNIGALFKQPAVGRTSLVARVNGKGFNLDDLITTIETDVIYLDANQYRYHQISVGGKIEHKMFNGSLNVNDPNADLSFNGTIDLNKEIPLYQFKARIEYANLQALHFDTSHIVLSSNIDINFAIKNLDQNNGVIHLSKILFIKNGVDYQIDDIMLSSATDAKQKTLTLQSDMVEVGMKGDFSFERLPNTVKLFAHILLPGYIPPVNQVNTAPQTFSYYLSITDSKVLSDLFFPELQVLNMHIKGDVNEGQSKLSFKSTIEELVYARYTLQNVAGDATIQSDGKGDINLKVATFLDKDTVVFKDLEAQSNVFNNMVTTQLLIRDTNSLIHCNIGSESFCSANEIRTSLNAGSFNYKHKTFTLSENGTINYDGTTGQFNILNFSLAHAEELIEMNGFYANNNQYNIALQLTEVGLSNINLFYPPLTISVGGKTNGRIVFKNNHESMLVNSFLGVKNLSLDNDTIGDFGLTSNYDETQKRIIAKVHAISGKLKDLTLGGYIDISNSPYAVNADIVFSESDLKSFQAFVKDDVSILYGKVSAKCKISGTVDNLLLDGNISMNQVLARIEYLKTVYGFNAHINFNKNNIQVVPFQLKDINGKQAMVSGNISHKSFSNLLFDIHIKDLNGFQVLNTTSKDNSLFYGTAYASGKMSLTGPMSDLLLDATLKSTKGTVFNIPLSSSEDNDGNELLNFINKDSTLKSVNADQESVLLGIGISMNVTVTPDAEIQLVFDEAKEDKIVGSGKGILQMDLTKQGAFSIYGEVAIEDGDYKFTAIDVFTRKFTLKKGGTITWTGDPFQAKMNLQGVYKVKNTSLANIMPNLTKEQQAEVNHQRVPVDCILNLKGNLLSPEIGFDINLPDYSSLTGNNASTIESYLRRLRSEPDLMQQQVVSLMLFGQFVPINPQVYDKDYFSSSINNTMSDLISAQATNLLASIIPGLSVSADYQYSAAAQQQAILSASKKFLKERFELKTSVDVMNPTINNSFIGQYDLSTDGNLKLRGFNRTAYNPIDSKNITSQGIGLYYRKEFDTFTELFLKKNKKIVVPRN
jgi:hypothetical protein